MPGEATFVVRPGSLLRQEGCEALLQQRLEDIQCARSVACGLQVKAAEAAHVPGLRQELRDARDHISRLQKERDNLQVGRHG